MAAGVIITNSPIPGESDGNNGVKNKSQLMWMRVKSLLNKAPAVLAEFIGTALLVCLGCMGCISGFETGPPPSMHLSFSFGMVVMFLIHIFGPISGAHFNPAVTFCALLWRNITPTLALIYVLAQVSGAWLGFGLLRLVTPTSIMYPGGFNVTGVCSTVPHAEITVIQAFVVEFLITGILVLVTCGCWDPVNAASSSANPLKFGFCIAAISMFAGTYTGASMNPARSLGPAIWNNDWDAHWIYWVSPLLSSLVCTLLYRFVFMKTTAKSKCEEPMEELPLSNQEKTSV